MVPSVDCNSELSCLKLIVQLLYKPPPTIPIVVSGSWVPWLAVSVVGVAFVILKLVQRRGRPVRHEQSYPLVALMASQP